MEAIGLIELAEGRFKNGHHSHHSGRVLDSWQSRRASGSVAVAVEDLIAAIEVSGVAGLLFQICRRDVPISAGQLLLTGQAYAAT